MPNSGKKTGISAALWLTIALIAVTILVCILRVFTSGSFDGFDGVSVKLINLLLACSIIIGVRETVPSVDSLGKKALVVCVIFTLADLLLCLAARAIPILSILSGIATICSFVYDIVYMTYLYNAKEGTK